MNLNRLLNTTYYALAKVSDGVLEFDVQQGKSTIPDPNYIKRYDDFQSVLECDLSVYNQFKIDLASRENFLGLSFDVSKRGTGVAFIVKRGCSIFYGTFTLKLEISTDNSLYYSDVFLTQKLFKGALTKILWELGIIETEYEFIDVCVIEDPVLNSKGAPNLNTLRNLITLNYCVDAVLSRLVGDDSIDYFERVKVESWKATLVAMAEGKGKYGNAKGQVREAMLALDESYLDNMRVGLGSQALLDDNGYQDRLDATGVLLHGLAVHFGKSFHSAKVNVTKNAKISVNFVIGKTYADLMSKDDVVSDKLLITYKTTGKQLENFIRQKFAQGHSEFVLEVTGGLGKFGIARGINEIEYGGRCYIYVKRKD